jgi:hypothetical protein
MIGPKVGSFYHADYKLTSARCHLLHQYAFDPRSRLVLLRRRDDTIKCGDHALSLFQV